MALCSAKLYLCIQFPFINYFIYIHEPISMESRSRVDALVDITLGSLSPTTRMLIVALCKYTCETKFNVYKKVY